MDLEWFELYSGTEKKPRFFNNKPSTLLQKYGKPLKSLIKSDKPRDKNYTSEVTEQFEETTNNSQDLSKQSQKQGALSFFDNEAEGPSSEEPDIMFVPTKSDDEFIDDSSLNLNSDNNIEIQKEHHRNVKRIAKNLDEFSDSLDFRHTDMNSLKSFILQML